MSIKNYNKVIYIKNLTNGNIDPIHDYFKYDKGIKGEILWQRLDNYLENGQNIAFEYGLEVKQSDF